jgi:membrane protein DedA with SNARE-associated domain
VPNPFFDVVGITAGATRMNFFLFLVAVGIGDSIRIALLIYLGDQFIDFTDFGI